MAKRIFRIKPIRRRIRIRRRVTWQTGKTDLTRDRQRLALPPGWRTSKHGKEYYEARKNRSDLDPKRKL